MSSLAPFLHGFWLMEASTTIHRNLPPRPKRHEHRTADLRAFMDRYATAIVAGDTKTLTSMWACPVLVITDEHVHLLATRREIEDFIARAKESSYELEAFDAVADILRLDWATPRTAIVDLRWSYREEAGPEIGTETSTYTLRYDEFDDLKIQCVLLRENDTQFSVAANLMS